MKRNLMLLSLGALAVLAFQVNPAAQSAGQNDAEPGPCDVAVVDVTYLYENHTSLKAGLNTMKAEVALLEADFAEEKKAIDAHKEEAKKNTDPLEAKRMAEALLREKAEHNVKLSVKRSEFLEREAELYLATYKHVNSIIEHFAKQRGLRLVIRTNSQENASPSREEILKMINAPIVYQDRIDITQDILALLNQKDMTQTQ